MRSYGPEPSGDDGRCREADTTPYRWLVESVSPDRSNQGPPTEQSPETSPGDPDGERYEVIEGAASSKTTWRIDREFMQSNWSCIWGEGCLGILAVPAPELNQGCCSVGAHLDGDEEAATIGGLAATLDPDLFQFHREADGGGVYADAERTNTRVVDGACIFLNRPGFAGGEGCALHLSAVADDESPLDWKPSVCWQLPIHVDWTADPDGSETATLRAWNRADWGDDGDPMHWCCTEGDLAYVGTEPVVDSLAPVLERVLGTEVYVELRRRLR